MERALQGQATGRWDGREWLVAVTIAVLVALGFARRVHAQDAGALEPLMFDGMLVNAADCPSASCPPDCCRVPHVLDPLGVDPLWSGRAEALLLWRQSP
jgi:hypothetical protein